MKTHFHRFLLLAALACGALRPTAHAAPFDWLGGSGIPINDWNDLNNWVQVAVPAPTDDAVFSGATLPPDLVDLNGNQSIQSLNFNLPVPFSVDYAFTPNVLNLGYSVPLNYSVNKAGSQTVFIYSDVACGPNLTLAGTGTGPVYFGADILNAPVLTVRGGLYYVGLGTAPGGITFQSITITGGQLNMGNSNQIRVLGPVVVSGGTLNVCNAVAPSASLTAPSVTVNAGGTLQGNGGVTVTTAPFLTVGVGSIGILSPGCSPGTMSVSGGLIMGPFYVFNAQLGPPNIVGSGVNDLIDVTANPGPPVAPGDLTLDGTLNITPLTGFGAGTYTLVTYAGVLTDNGLAIGNVPTGFKYTINTATLGQVKLLVERCVSYTGTTLTENFDSMGPTGTQTPPGWYAGYSGPTTLTTVGVSAGSNAPNATVGWNFGSTGATDRALGTMSGSFSNAPASSRYIETRICNDSGQSLSTLTVSYVGEQYRTGSASNLNNLVLRYSSDGVNYVNVGTALNFNQPTFTPVNSALDGNGATNRRTNRGGTFAPASPVPPGGTIYLRLFDADVTGTDPALAIDDFSFSVVAPLAPTYPPSPDVCYDFNDGLVPAGTTNYGSAYVDGSGGVGNSGALKLTDAANNQNASFLINDFRNGAPVTGFCAALRVQLCCGSTNPADGWSFNWATNLPSAPFPQGEAGAGTGLTVSFDSYDGSANPPTVDVKWGGVTLGNVKVATLATGTSYYDVFINLKPNLTATAATLDVVYGGVTLYSGFPVPGYTPLAGAKFGLAARTGALTQTHWFDDVCIQALPCFTLTCPSDLSLPTCSNTAPANFSATVSGPCAASIVPQCAPSPGNFPIGVTTVTCTATDSSGNSQTCQFFVTVLPDAVPPQITCPSGFLRWTCAAGIEVEFESTATDDCGYATVTCQILPAGPAITSPWVFPMGSTTVECTATDNAGNTDSCTFPVVVTGDLTPPWACSGTVGADLVSNGSFTGPPGMSTVPAPWIDIPPSPSFGGTCDTFSPGGFGLFGPGIPASPDGGTMVGGTQAGSTVPGSPGEGVQQTLTGLTPYQPYLVEFYQANAGITVIGGFEPGHWQVTLEGGPSQDSPTMPFVGIGAQTWQPVALTFVPVTSSAVLSFESQYNGTVPGYAYMALDGVRVRARNTGPCPCGPDITINNDPGQCGAQVEFPLPVFNDNCPGSVTVVCTPPSLSFFAAGTTAVTCTGTDAAGNTGTCSFNVTVTLTATGGCTNCCAGCVAPFPASFTIAVNPGYNYLVNPLCHGSANTAGVILGSMADQTVLYTWDKATGSLTSDTYDATLAGWVNPNQPLDPGVGFILLSPVAFTLTFTGCEPHCPPRCPKPNETCLVGNTGSAPGASTWDSLFGSNCPPVCGSTVNIFNPAINPPNGGFDQYAYLVGGWSPSTPSWPNGTSVFVSWQATNCAPCETFCASNKMVECGSTWSFDSPTSSCTNATITPLAITTNGTCPMVITQTWSVILPSGQSNGCSQTVTVVDTTPPVLTCASNKTVDCCGATVTLTFTGTVASVVNPPPLPPFFIPSLVPPWNGVNVGDPWTLTYTFNPLAPDVNSLPTQGDYAAAVSTFTVTAGPATTTQTISGPSPWAVLIVLDNQPAPFDQYQGDFAWVQGVPMQLVFTLQNGAGGIWNSDALPRCLDLADFPSAQFTVSKGGSPFGIMGPITGVTCVTNPCAPWQFNAPTASDTCCTNVTLSFSTVTNGTCPQVVARTWLASDCCSNTATCSQTVTVVDTTPPVLTCASNKLAACGSAWSFDAPAASDTCCGTNVTLSFSTVTNGTCPQIITRTWLASDCCSNSITCTQTVTVVDTTPPLFTNCGTNKTVQCSPATNGWSACDCNASFTARYEHTAIWTGTKMLLWGGFNGTTYFNDGVVYDPVTRTCTAMSTANAPSPRYRHTAVLDPVSGDMIVWGGLSGITFPNDGARYKPSTDTWTPISIPVGLAGRHYHTAVLAPTTGEMIVWGGRNTSSGLLNSGGRYKLANDTWTLLPIGGAPSPRLYHEAAWAGTTGEMIIWGGTDLGTIFGDGARYDPVNNVWKPMNSGGGARSQFTSAWSGTEMLVWGGASGAGNLNTGARYTPGPGGGTWTAMTTANAPAARHGPLGVWAGGAFIVWGGGLGGTGFNTGGCYDPVANAWTALPTTVAPPGRYFGRAVWTGSEMIITGGRNPASNPLVTVYDDTWCINSCVPWQFDAPTASDACAGTNVTVTFSTVTNGVCPQIITRTWQVTDWCSNSATCSQNVTVVDTTPPMLTCASNKTVVCGSAWSFDPPTAGDTCCTNVTLTFSTVTNGFCPLVITRTWLASDCCSNTASCSQSVTNVPGCIAPPPGMVLWLPFDETSGTTALNLAGGNQGVHVNGPAFNPGGHVANSLCFDNVDDYVEVPSYPALGFGTGDFSVDAWVKVNPGDNSLRAIVEHRKVTPGPTVIGYVLLLWFDNSIAFQLGDGASWVNFNSSLAVPADGQWHFVAVTVKRSSTTGISFYMDGLPPQQANPTPFPGSVTPPANYPLHVGGSPASGTFNGCIDEVELFNRELAPAEIASLYHAGTSGKCKPLLTCPGDKFVVCGSAWSFDPPIVGEPCCGANATLSVTTVTNGVCPQIITRTWQVTDCCSNTATCSQTVTAGAPPVIATPPASQLAQLGDSVTFTVAASGTGPFTSEWQVQEANGEFKGKESECCFFHHQCCRYDEFTTVAIASGNYRVVIMSPFGSITSQVAVLTVNRPPVAGADTLATIANRSVSISRSKLLINDSDADGDTLTITAFSPTSDEGGNVTFSPTHVTYAPRPGFTGADSFTYTIGDGRGGSATGTVEVQVGANNLPSQNQLAVIRLPNGDLELAFAGIPGRAYPLECTATVAAPDWAQIATLVAPSNGIMRYRVTPSQPSAFYRTVVAPPAPVDPRTLREPPREPLASPRGCDAAASTPGSGGVGDWDDANLVRRGP